MTSSDDSKRRARFTELMTTHGEAVYGVCLRMVQHEATARDVLQQTFLEAYRDLDRFEGRAAVRSWLIGIAKHRCLDAIKRERRRDRWLASDDEAVHAQPAPDAGPAERLDREQLYAALEHCIRRLPPLMRVAVLERFTTGATYEELVGLLGASANTLQVRVARGLRQLKDCLEKRGWGHD